jgi:hypothetical protein
MPKKERQLALHITGTVPRGTSRKEFSKVLMKSIEDQSYTLPEGYTAQIKWSNNEGRTWKEGEWQEELEASAEGPSGSAGFEFAVLKYLEPKAGELEIEREEEKPEPKRKRKKILVRRARKRTALGRRQRRAKKARSHKARARRKAKGKKGAHAAKRKRRALAHRRGTRKQSKHA